MNEINKKNHVLLGAHMSISGGLHKAIEAAAKLECTALQIFTKNSSNWKEKYLSEKDIETFRKAARASGITQIFSHTSYLINLAGNDPEKYEKSVNALEKELIRASDLGIPYVVLHPGNHMGQGVSTGIDRISDSINHIFDNTPGCRSMLLLETTSGQGSSIGHTFEQLAEIIKQIKNQKRVGVCLDTCHIFAAGYDIREKDSYEATMRHFDKTIGHDRLFLIHMNDSKKELGSHVDRHAHIGEGHIGIHAFSYIMNDKKLENIPKIIETPGEKNGIPYDHINLNLLRSLIQT